MRVSVCIPTYNYARFLRAAVESAVQQNVPEMEVIVVDNCSTDDTNIIGRALEAAHDCVRYVRNDRNLGLFGNFNRCIELARGKYLKLLCADDRLASASLSAEIALLEANPRAGMVSARGRFESEQRVLMGDLANFLPAGVYEGVTAMRAWLALYTMTRFNAFNYPSGVLFRSDSVRDAGGFDATMRTTGDIEFYFRVLKKSQLIVADHLGAYIACHPGQSHHETNLDGTAWREHCMLVDRYAGSLMDGRKIADLYQRMHSMAVLLALFRCAMPATRESARIHLRLALQSQTSLLALAVRIIPFLAARLRWQLARRLPRQVTDELQAVPGTCTTSGYKLPTR